MMMESVGTLWMSMQALSFTLEGVQQFCSGKGAPLCGNCQFVLGKFWLHNTNSSETWPQFRNSGPIIKHK